MAKVENLISEIADARLREGIAREVAALKKLKKFGLVFEEHIPEQVQLPGLPVKAGTRVVKRDQAKDVFLVENVAGNGRARIRRETGDGQGEAESVRTKDLVAVKRFGEPIYPTLVPVARLTQAEGKPYHTIINADNFHALQLLLYCYAAQVDAIYIDPPYNTGARDWKYNNDFVDSTDRYRHSKWLSMIKKRLLLARRLLKPDGILICAVDENEHATLLLLLGELLPERKCTSVAVVHNPRGVQGDNFSYTNDFAVYVTPARTAVITDRPISQQSSNLRNWGGESLRTDARNCFYPIFVKGETVTGFGDVPPAEFHPGGPNLMRPDGSQEVWPIDAQGVERKWRYARQSVESVARLLVVKQGRKAIDVHIKKEAGKWKTVWQDPRYDGSTYGTQLVTNIVGCAFPFPKSLYTVFDNLYSCTADKKNALILDFFAGSGTTYHATALLNAADGGSRRSILVTNNEVAERDARPLNAAGLFPGDADFEKHGICNSVTWPRCKYVTQGHRDDGTPLPGEYLSGGAMSDGFHENLEYFRLDFLDPHEVAYGDRFEAILPILWLMAGAKGQRETARGFGKWFIPKDSPYAVLIKEEHFADFRKELAGRGDIAIVFLVTDSEDAFREMSAGLPGSPQTKMLYKSYLDNFRINLEKET